MSSAPTATATSPVLELVNRVRFFAAVGLAWLVLGLVAGWGLPYGLDRPLTIVAAPSAFLALVLLPLGVCMATLAGLMVSARRNVTRAIVLASFGLLIWIAPCGTIDDWLILMQPVPGPPSGGVYWPLLVDYAALIVVLAGLAKVASVFGYGGSARRALRLTEFKSELSRGPLALGSAVVVAIAVMWPLMGSPVEETLRGQVWFAVGLAFAAGGAVGRNIAGVHHPLWYLPAPIIVGMVGVIVAAISPALTIPESYRSLNSIPAWWLVRPLPLEMVAMGWLGLVWALGWEQPAEAQERRPL